jgi:hypothetical protein
MHNIAMPPSALVLEVGIALKRQEVAIVQVLLLNLRLVACSDQR